MIVIKGKSRAGAASLAKHLMNERTNDRVTVAALRGTLADDLLGCFQEIEDVASGTRCTKALYHAQINPDPTEPLTPEQWRRSIELLEEKLGLSGNHPRAVVFHEKEGRQHAHVVWGRIDPETMLAWHDGLNYQKHELAARALEREFGREQLTGAFTRSADELRPERTPETWEMQQGDRLAVDARQFRAALRDMHSRCDNGPSFAVALDEAGYTLCQGEKRDFVILDQAGGVHSLGRALGVKAAALRDYMAEVDREALPTVADARAVALAKEPEPQPPPVAAQREAAPLHPVHLDDHAAHQANRQAARIMVAGVIGEAWRESQSDPMTFAIRLGEQGLTLAQNAGGRFVAVDSDGATHYLTEQATGAPPRAVQRTIAEGFGEALSVPTVADVREQLRAEQRVDRAARREAEAAAARAVREEQRQQEGAAWVEERRAERALKLGDLVDVERLRATWQRSDNAAAFVAAIEADGFTLGRVSAEEAGASAQLAQAATSRGDYAPTLPEGALVAFSERGASFRLDGATLNDATAPERLASVDGSAMLTLAQARQVAEHFADAPERGTPHERPGRSDDRAGAELGSLAMRGAEGVADALGGVAEGIERFFFGSSAPAPAAPAAPAEPSPPRRLREAQTIRRQEKSAASTEPNTQELIRQQPQNLDADLLAEMRRFREAREREERERDGGRERDR